MTISIIIPTLNEENRIEHLLKSIAGLSEISLGLLSEVIVCDNGSTDKTVNIAKRYTPNVFTIKEATIAKLRNIGALKANGDIFIFSDADNIFSKKTIEVVNNLLSQPDIGIVGPNGLIPSGNPTWVQKLWHFHTVESNLNNNLAKVDSIGSGFLAIRKDIFWLVDGFNESLNVGEDTDLCRKITSLGYYIFKSSSLSIENSGHPKTINSLIKREFWHGDNIITIFSNKTFDLLTLYFVSNLVLLIFSIFFYIRMSSFALIFVAFFYVSIPGILRAYKKVHFFSFETFKLAYIYIIYIYSRTFALIKLNR